MKILQHIRDLNLSTVYSDPLRLLRVVSGVLKSKCISFSSSMESGTELTSGFPEVLQIADVYWLYHFEFRT